MFKNFKRYIPEDSDPRILFLKSECGKDWYECQKYFSKETIKIMVDSDFKIISASKDISMLFPENCSIYEVDELDINQVYLKELYFLENKILEKNIENRELFVKNKLITIETEIKKAKRKRKKIFLALDLYDKAVMRGDIEENTDDKIARNNFKKLWLDITTNYTDLNIPIENYYPIIPNKIKYFLGEENE